MQLSLVSLAEEVRQIPPGYAKSFRRILDLYEKTSGDKYADAMAALPASLQTMSVDAYKDLIKGLAEKGISASDIQCFKKAVSLLRRRSWRTRLRTASGANGRTIKQRLARAKKSLRVANFESSLQMIRSYAIALRRYMAAHGRIDIPTADHIFKTVILYESKILEKAEQDSASARHQKTSLTLDETIFARNDEEARFAGMNDVCPYCGSPVDDDRASCPHCGQFYEIVITKAETQRNLKRNRQKPSDN